jgi:anaerobic selenocysteine-containing dehydrogenase
VHVVQSDVEATLAQVPSGAKVAIVWDGVDLELGKLLADRSSGLDAAMYIASEQPNARGAEAMGMLPIDGGMDVALMFDAGRNGKLAALSLFGVNPVRNAPDADLVRAALHAIPFVMISELFMTETAQHADLVLPAKGAFEKSGTTTNLTGDLLAVNASLDAPVGPLSDLEMLIGLAQQFDLTLPTIEEVDVAVVARAQNAFAGNLGDALFHSAAGRAPDSVHRLEPRTLWDGGGTAAHDERVASLRGEAVEA